MHIYIKNKKLFLDHYKIKCSIGKRGIGTKKREGDKITPKGKFKIKSILYRKDRISNFKSKIRKLSIQKNMGWCDDPDSKHYNKLIKFPFKYSAEKLYRNDNTYDIILVLNYNLNPIRKRKGSAIFIHIAKKNYKKTLGCIAVSKKDLKKIIKKINKTTTVNII
jgi:L,D-peptidoglycan transpeptidase YkuD (ErfK/YbiS/YcfS/YnhG family)